MNHEPRYFSPRLFTRTLFDATFMMVKYKRQLKLINKHFRSDIMLAVTNVNGCRLCSYYHTHELIKTGASPDELKAVLGGEFQQLDPYEGLALMFAEHYADKSGNYNKEDFAKVKEFYGPQVATGIMATIKLIMFGNMDGIAMTNVKERLLFRHPVSAKWYTDLYIAFSPIFLMIPFIFINIFRKKVKF